MAGSHAVRVQRPGQGEGFDTYTRAHVEHRKRGHLLLIWAQRMPGEEDVLLATYSSRDWIRAQQFVNGVAEKTFINPQKSQKEK